MIIFSFVSTSSKVASFMVLIHYGLHIETWNLFIYFYFDHTIISGKNGEREKKMTKSQAKQGW